MIPPRWRDCLQRARRESAQIVVLFALFVVVLMILAGSAYDYGSILVDGAQLQNAVDAAVLAGSNTLSANAALPANTAVAIAQATTTAYLNSNGVVSGTNTTVSMTFPTSTPVGGTGPSSQVIDNLTLSVTRKHPTSFWPLAGINSVSMQSGGSAHAARGMTDIMLSLDTTGSEIVSGSFPAIQQAVVDFINQVNPTTGDPRGPKVGIARYAGIICTWHDDNNDGLVDMYYTTSVHTPSEYVAPCKDDDTMLTSLTNDKQVLLTVANNSGTSACPASSIGFACPLQHVNTTVREATTNASPNGLVIDTAYPAGTGARITEMSGTSPYYTGTKEPNSVCVVNPTDALCPNSPSSLPGYAWSTANGGRNGAGNSQARRVMVIMTDGQDEAWPTNLAAPGSPDPFPESVTAYDANVVTLANNLKANPAPDGGPGVEIFVVGYFCTDWPSTYSPGTYPPLNFCQSQIAYSSVPRGCPGNAGAATPTSGLSNIDQLLITISSSSPGTCDHYYPLSKSENLPTLFQALAGKISRGQLTQ